MIIAPLADPVTRPNLGLFLRQFGGGRAGCGGW